MGKDRYERQEREEGNKKSDTGFVSGGGDERKAGKKRSEQWSWKPSGLARD